MNKKQIKQCAIYTRVSTDLQVEEEFSSCEAQEEKIRSFVKSQNNWQVFKVYSDAGYTGANTNRPALQELFEDIKQYKKLIKIIFTYKLMGLPVFQKILATNKNLIPLLRQRF